MNNLERKQDGHRRRADLEEEQKLEDKRAVQEPKEK